MTTWNSLWGTNHYLFYCHGVYHSFINTLNNVCSREMKLLPLPLKAFTIFFLSNTCFIFFKVISAMKIKDFKENIRKKNELIVIETGLVRGLGLVEKQTQQKLIDLFPPLFFSSQVQFKFQVMYLLRHLPVTVPILLRH